MSNFKECRLIIELILKHIELFNQNFVFDCKNIVLDEIKTIRQLLEQQSEGEEDPEKIKSKISELFDKINISLFKFKEKEQGQNKKFAENLKDNSDKIIESISTVNNEMENILSKVDSAENYDDIVVAKELLSSQVRNFIQFTLKIKEDIAGIQKEINDQIQSILSYEAAVFNLKKQIYTDEMTSLLNKRGLEESYNLMLRSSRDSCILFLDIDHFKIVNDTYGHLAGDLILKKFANILLTSIRDGDIVSRVYGDEFVIILRNSNLQFAKVISERIKKRISKAVFFYNDKSIKITVSGGLCKVNKWLSFKEVLEKVDALLYKAKQIKNIICVE